MSRLWAAHHPDRRLQGGPARSRPSRGVHHHRPEGRIGQGGQAHDQPAECQGRGRGRPRPCPAGRSAAVDAGVFGARSPPAVEERPDRQARTDQGHGHQPHRVGHMGRVDAGVPGQGRQAEGPGQAEHLGGQHAGDSQRQDTAPTGSHPESGDQDDGAERVEARDAECQGPDEQLDHRLTVPRHRPPRRPGGTVCPVVRGVPGVHALPAQSLFGSRWAWICAS